MIFINENFSSAIESIVYNYRKLRQAKIIDFCYSRDGIICVKITANSKPEKINHMKELGLVSRICFFKSCRKHTTC